MFTPKQINQILSNKNVDRCSSKSIAYNIKFKIDAIKKYYNEGYSPHMIFKEARFDLDLIGKDKIKGCLARWRKIYEHKGIKGLSNDNIGGNRRKSKIKYKNDKEKIEYLETEVAYLKTENDFLKKIQKSKKP